MYAAYDNWDHDDPNYGALINSKFGHFISDNLIVLK